MFFVFMLNTLDLCVLIQCNALVVHFFIYFVGAFVILLDFSRCSILLPYFSVHVVCHAVLHRDCSFIFLYWQHCIFCVIVSQLSHLILICMYDVGGISARVDKLNAWWFIFHKCTGWGWSKGVQYFSDYICRENKFDHCLNPKSNTKGHPYDSREAMH